MLTTIEAGLGILLIAVVTIMVMSFIGMLMTVHSIMEEAQELLDELSNILHDFT